LNEIDFSNTQICLLVPEQKGQAALSSRVFQLPWIPVLLLQLMWILQWRFACEEIDAPSWDLCSSSPPQLT